MRTVRLFISSPGDVSAEREKAREILGRQQVRFSGKLVIQPYFWEHDPMRAHTDYQTQIEAPSKFDVFICLLWARLGTRLHPDLHAKPDGSPYASGTEFELLDALDGFRRNGTPQVLIYRKQGDPIVPIKPKEVREAILGQYDALEEFYRELTLKDQSFVVATNKFSGLDDFERKFEHHMEKVLARFVGPNEQEISKAPKSWSVGSPFRGLLHFDYEHAAIFFGRTRAIDEVLSLLRHQAAVGRAFVLVFGSSGVGKSSLIRAGVLPWLVRPGVIDGVGLWRRGVLRPNEQYAEDLFDVLAQALVAGEGLPELLSDGTSVTEIAHLLRENPGGVALLIKGALSQAAREVQVNEKLSHQPRALYALVLDQMEELFTSQRFAAGREEFLGALDALARSGHVWVMATLRSDFFHRCEDSSILMDLKKGGEYHLQPPDQTQVGQMIRLPAAAAGVYFEEDYRTGERLEDILRDAASKSPSALPLLEFALEELYKLRDEATGRLRLEDYRTIGGVEGALARRAEETCLQSHDVNDEHFDLVFRGMVTVSSGDNDPPVRKRARKVDLETLEGARILLDRLIQSKLVIADRANDGVIVVSLAHEALLTSWPRLESWVEVNHDLLKATAQVTLDAARWIGSGKKEDYLYNGGLPLEKSRRLLEDGLLTGDEAGFVQASSRRVHLQRVQQMRRWKQIAAGFGIFAAATCVMAVLFLLQREAAEGSQKEAEVARDDTDALNLFMLGDLREQLEETGHLDVLDSSAERASQYLNKRAVPLSGRSVNNGDGDQKVLVMQLELAYNLSRVRIGQGRFGEAIDSLKVLECLPPDVAGFSTDVQFAIGKVLNSKCDVLGRTTSYSEGVATGERALLVLGDMQEEKATLLRADVLINLADINRRTGQYARAMSQIDEAIRVCEPLCARSGSRPARRILLRAMLRQCDFVLSSGQLERAKVLGIQRSALAERYDIEEPLSPLWKVERGLSLDRLAQINLKLRELQHAKEYANGAMAIWVDLLQSDSDNREWMRLKATAETKLGQIHMAMGQAELALTHYQNARSIMDRLTSVAPRNFGWRAGLATSLSLLGDAQSATGRGRAGRASYEAALKMRREVYDDPVGRVDADNAGNLVVSLTKAAVAYIKDDEYAEAERVAVEALRIAEKVVDKNGVHLAHQDLLAAAIETFAETQVIQERQPIAAVKYAEARDLRRKISLLFPDDPAHLFALAQCQMLLGELYIDGTHKTPPHPDLSSGNAELRSARTLLVDLAKKYPDDVRYSRALEDVEKILRD